jgi:hypothetical protein
MSDRTSKRDDNDADIWWVYPVDGSKSPVLFSGTLAETVKHITTLHVNTGIEHRCMRVNQ